MRIMNNTIHGLNNEFFKQMARLTDGNLKGSELKDKIERSKAVKELGLAILASAGLILKAHVTVANSVAKVDMPALIGGTVDDEDDGNVDDKKDDDREWDEED